LDNRRFRGTSASERTAPLFRWTRKVIRLEAAARARKGSFSIRMKDEG
jgi:hypothetical protein